jgi:hypothetical protein
MDGAILSQCCVKFQKRREEFRAACPSLKLSDRETVFITYYITAAYIHSVSRVFYNSHILP